ncbi:nuclear pore complex protein Nup98-Nup96-like, partial [Protobothrops mucrosquamatus]|uniref:nuclear pore complex protein Nup98-Nup96-like n=1 Tax=Protobothrops mucrosquamatus TaxID=103944 RepID=UPI000775B880
DLRLSLLLSQLVGSQEVRELLALQLADWHQLQADVFIRDERLRIFCLLAGKPVWQLSEKRTINVCSQLDWKRSLGIHLWFLLPSTAPLSKALSMYEAAFQLKYALQRMRERAVRELLSRHCKLLELPESRNKEAFLTEKLCVPPAWIYEAKALWARREGDSAREALYLFKAGHWNQCHQLVVRHLASDAIINENYTYLKGFLEDLSSPERCSLIQGWDTAGLVFLDYLQVIEMVNRIQQLDCTGYELEELHSKVISLCSRIELVQCHSAKDRLAQS